MKCPKIMDKDASFCSYSVKEFMVEKGSLTQGSEERYLYRGSSVLLNLSGHVALAICVRLSMKRALCSEHPSFSLFLFLFCSNSVNPGVGIHKLY